MAREASFNFMPEATLPTKAEKNQIRHWASVNKAYNTIRFSPEYITDKKMDGGFIKLYYDKQKKSIGWRLMHEKSLGDMAKYRQVNVSIITNAKGYTTRVCSLGIKKILSELGLKEDDTFNRVEIKTYKEQGMLSNVYDYIKLV